MTIQNISFDRHKKILVVLVILIILIVATVLVRHFWLRSSSKKEMPTNPALYKDIEYKTQEK